MGLLTTVLVVFQGGGEVILAVLCNCSDRPSLPIVESQTSESNCAFFQGPQFIISTMGAPVSGATHSQVRILLCLPDYTSTFCYSELLSSWLGVGSLNIGL